MTTEVKALNGIEQLKLEVQKELENYPLVAITDDASFKEAKKQRAELNKLSTKVDTERKRITKELKTSIDSIIELIPIAIMDSQINEYEEKLKLQREADIQALFNELEFPIEIDLAQITNSKWLNITFEYEKELRSIREKVSRDLELLPLISTLPGAYERYYNTLDLSQVKEYLESLKQVEISNDATLPFEPPFEPIEETYTSFVIKVPNSKLQRVRNFLFESGVEIEQTLQEQQ